LINGKSELRRQKLTKRLYPEKDQIYDQYVGGQKQPLRSLNARRGRLGGEMRQVTKSPFIKKRKEGHLW